MKVKLGLLSYLYYISDILFNYLILFIILLIYMNVIYNDLQVEKNIYM